jgi:hypothetical protein
MDKTSSSQKSSFIASTLTKQNEKHATQTSNDLIGQFSRFNIAEIDAEPKIPETKTTDAEQSTHISTANVLTVEQEQQNILVTNFVDECLIIIKRSNINPENIKENILLPCIEDKTFFLSISPYVDSLIKAINENSLNFDTVTNAIICQLKSSGTSLQLTHMCHNLLNSAKQYEQQKQQLSLFLGLNSEEGKQYIENLYKLFIEGDILYNKNYTDFYYDTNNKGPYVFENEKGYITICFTSFSYTFEELIIKNKQLSLQLVSNIMKIFGSSIYKYATTFYTSYFSQHYSSWAAKLLAQGKIAKYIIIDDTDDISEIKKLDIDIRITKHHLLPRLFKVAKDKSIVEDYINNKLDDNTYITLKQSAEDPNYYIVDTIEETKNSKIIITSTSDISDRQACIFETMYTTTPTLLNTKISFDKTYKADEYIQSLIDTYNNETAQTQTDLEYATSVMKFAGSLQRAHIYQDCNGRTSFFNLVPVLLMKRGLCLTKQPFNLWLLIDSKSPEELAKKYLNLCIKMPEIHHNAEYDWCHALPVAERLRIALATNNRPVTLPDL